MRSPKVPRWLIAYGALMAFAAVGNMIGGVPETVSWQLLVGGGVVVLQALREYLLPAKAIEERDKVRSIGQGRR